MAGYNRVIMVGNLTKDPEYKQLQSGQGLCKLSIAANRQYKNRQTGEMAQEVCYVDIDVWGAQAESSNRYLQKGRPVLIEGRLKFDTWENNEGQMRSKHSIVADRVQFLGSGQTDETGQGQQSTSTGGQNTQQQISAQKTDNNKSQFKDEPPFEDDLPF
jgi:single-strand DNA-binding protein